MPEMQYHLVSSVMGIERILWYANRPLGPTTLHTNMYQQLHEKSAAQQPTFTKIKKSSAS